VIYRTLPVAMLFVLLAGCASQSTTAKVMISEGCVVVIEGISTAQAQDILRTWDIDPKCQVEVRATAGDDDADTE